MKSLEILLKKCPNITLIELEDDDEYDYNEVFEVITKCCNNLRQIYVLNNIISDENIEGFHQKFGPKINFIHRLKDANNYNLFPNIEKINAFHLKSIDFIPRLKLSNLKILLLIIEDGEENVIKTCVDSFLTLTHLCVAYISKNEKSIFTLLEFVSNLQFLRFDSYQSISQRLSRIESVLNLRPIHLRPKKKINQNKGQKQWQKSGSNTNWRQNSNSNQKSRVFYGSDYQNHYKNMYFKSGRQLRPSPYPHPNERHNYWPPISDYHPNQRPINWNQMTENRFQPNYRRNSYHSQRPENNHFLGQTYPPIVRHY